ncbi:hypothetical protein BDQ94DRAFT_186493 [Aspergillus welwitschiae]|uniref:Uncharacterized protein n=1 Tax=Aspergillus welwitschiae TaxID=1341132 RepID=A0A3F3PI52_9EURO|nr:hypothetical protein BDQ94DRAFT_186493 [Aspergillus welwitschiae]RDH26635.1 hypothetical protein BDQ94DRAFT_186493 [Aspergillus welwitschiae]
MSADPNHYGTVSGPPAITEDPRPGFVPISNNDPWLLISFSPPMSWAVGPAVLTDSTASSEASFIAPYPSPRSSAGGGIGRGARRHGEIAELGRLQKGRPWCLYMFA